MTVSFRRFKTKTLPKHGTNFEIVRLNFEISNKVLLVLALATETSFGVEAAFVLTECYMRRGKRWTVVKVKCNVTLHLFALNYDCVDS